MTAERTAPTLPSGEPVTLGVKYGYAMEITDANEARAYFAKLVEHNLSCGGKSRAVAESVERQNLGYYAGYYSHETRQRVERLFDCSHPVFGKATGNPVSPTDALADGTEAAHV